MDRVYEELIGNIRCKSGRRTIAIRAAQRLTDRVIYSLNADASANGTSIFVLASGGFD